MSVSLPTSKTALNVMSHSNMHRVVAVDLSAPEQSLIIDSAGNGFSVKQFTIGEVPARGTAASIYLTTAVGSNRVESRTAAQVATDLNGSVVHNSLSGIDAGDIQHLTLAEHNGLVGGGATALHAHYHEALLNVDSGTYLHLSSVQRVGLTTGVVTSLHKHDRICEPDGTFDTALQILTAGNAVFYQDAKLLDDKSIVLGLDEDINIKYQSIFNRLSIDCSINAACEGLFLHASELSGAGLVIDKVGGVAYDHFPKLILYNKPNDVVGGYALNGKEIGRIQFQGDTNFTTDSEHGAWVSGYTSDDWALNYNPAEIRFYVTRKTVSNNAINTVTFTDDQKIKLIYTSAGADSGSAYIYASGYGTLYLGGTSSPFKVGVGGSSSGDGTIGIRTFSQNGIPSTSDIRDGYCGFWIDTDAGDALYLVYNQGGSMKKVSLA
jgi:hypothetical protein